MSLYRSMYYGINGQAHACTYHSHTSKKDNKTSVFDNLQNSIREHREHINAHYSDIN